MHSAYTPKAASPPPIWVRRLASLKLTLALIGLFFLAVASLRWTSVAPTWLLALPLSLTALNLAAALWAHRRLRRNVPMFVFHLSLLALLMLAALGRMTYLKGVAEVTEGAPFSGQLREVQQGPWHWASLQPGAFRNLDLRVHYVAGPTRAETHNRLQWLDGGQVRETVIGDQYPLVIDGYRIYTTRNFGFAPVFTWYPAAGQAQRGSVHLNQYPSGRLNQVQEWLPPGSQTRLWIKLDFEDNLLPADRDSVLRPPSEHRLVIRFGEQRYELLPGQSMALPEGRLHYDGLSMWMGYRFHYDWTIPWMLAVSLFGVGSLLLHFLQQLRARPWQRLPAMAGHSH